MDKRFTRSLPLQALAVTVMLLAGFAAVNMASGWRFIDSGAAIWGVGAIAGVALLFSLHQWRPWRYEMPLRDRKTYIVSQSLSLAFVLVCTVNLVPAQRWTQLDQRIAHALEVPAASRVQAAPQEAKPDDVNTWGTLFAWLLAVVALVIAFVTSWVFSLSREIKEQVEATQAALDQHLKSITMNHHSVDAIANLLRLTQYVDKERFHTDHMVVRHLLATIHHSAAFFRPFPDVANSMRELDRKRIAMKAIFDNTTSHPDVRLTLRDQVAPCLLIYVEALGKHAPMQCDEGDIALRHLSDIARLCRGR